MPSSSVGLTRLKQATAVAQCLAAASGKLVVLYGKRGTGKSELIHESLLPLLSQSGPVYYAECQSDLPPRLQSGEGEIAIDWTALPAGTVILDDFDRLLAQAERPRRELLKRFIAAIRASAGRSTVAAIVRDDNLRDLFVLRDAMPELTENLFELPELSLAEALESLAAAEPSGTFTYDPELLKTIEADLARCKETSVSPVLIHAIHSVLKRSPVRRPGTPVGLAEYRAANHLKGILDAYLARRLRQLAESIGGEASQAARAILEEVVLADAAGAVPDLREIPARLGISEQAIPQAIEWLERPPHLLRSFPGGRFDVRPAQMAELIQEQLELQQPELHPAQRALAEGVRAFQELGSVIPNDRFHILHALRRQLRTTPEQAALMVQCALRYDEDAGYWIARIPDRSDRLATLLRAVCETRPEVRERAARLLGDYDEPEVRHQLYRLALEDAEPTVRQQALASLERFPVEDFRDRLEEEARDADSPFRANAVEALRMFRDPRSTALLHSMVIARDSDPSIRKAAIGTLAAISTADAVDALGDIALNDDDASDRDAAATALASISSADLQRRALDNLRRSAAEHRAPRAPFGLRTALTAAANLLLALAVAAGNVVLHGLALAVLRRFKLAAIFFGIEALAVASWFTGWQVVAGVGALVFFLNALASQLFAFRLAETSGAAPAGRSSFRTLLGFFLLLGNLLTLVFFHGLAHLMIKRVRRAFTLFGLELLGIACVVILFAYPDVFTAANVPTAGMLNRVVHYIPLVLSAFYVAGAVVLFVGSFLWDIGGAGYLVLRSRRLVDRERRRNHLRRELMANPEAAGVVLDTLESPDRAAALWARRMVRRFGRAMPAARLLEWLHGDPVSAPRPALSALAQAKEDSSLEALCALWPRASGRLRSRILRVLAIDPSEASLRCFRTLLPEARPFWRARYLISALNYAVRLWPKPLLVLATWLFPLLLVLFYEGVATTRNKARPLIKEMGGNIVDLVSPGAWSLMPLRPHNPSQQIRAVSETARFLARRYPEQSARDLIDMFHYVRTNREDRLRETRRALLDSVATLASQSGQSYQPDAHTALMTALAAPATPDARAPWFETLGMLLAIAQRQPATRAAMFPAVVREQAALKDEARRLLAANTGLFRLALVWDLDAARRQYLFDALEIAGSSEAVAALREFVLSVRAPSVEPRPENARKQVEQALQVQRTSEQALQVQRIALDSLRRIGTPDSRAALAQIAGSTRSESLRRSAEEQLRQSLGNRIIEAQAALARHDYAQALQAGQELVGSATDPAQKAGVLLVLGEASYQRSIAPSETDKDRAAALEDAIRYLQQASGEPRAPHLLALSRASKSTRLLEAGTAQQALELARLAVQADPKCKEAYAAEGSALLKLGDHPGALGAFGRASEIAPDYTWAWYMQAQVASLDQNYGRAEELAQKAIRTDPDTGWTYALLLRIYLDQNRAADAVNAFERLSDDFPNSPYPRQELGYLYQEFVARDDPGAYVRACSIFKQLREEARANTPDKQAADANYAECSLTTRNYREAAQVAGALLSSPAGADYQQPMQVILYAALVAGGEYERALKQLPAIEKTLDARKLADEATWSYNGTLAYLERRAGLSEPPRSVLVRLVTAASDPKSKDVQAAVAANRAALGALLKR